MTDDLEDTISSSVIRPSSSFFRCPACGKGKLFKNPVMLADYCNACGLPFRPEALGDGPASLSILIVGALAGIGASVLDVKYQPPFWVHAAIWIPLVIIGSLVSLRWLKALTLAVHYRTRPDDFI